MSREIKFRIWDGNKNEWLGASDKDTLTYYGFHLVGEVMTVQSPPQWALDEGNVVEQYTGLKDKNGKEIYEGDIVEYLAQMYPEMTDTICRDVVRWCEEQACFAFGGAGFANFLNYDGEQLEVIGNIHENPELLEGEK